MRKPAIGKSAAQSPRYEEHPPGEAAAAFVSCFWSFTIPPDAQPFQHAIIPDGTISIAFIRKRAPDLQLLTLTGPTVSARWIAVNASDTFWGARLMPGAAPALLGVSPGTLRDQVRPLAELAPQLAERMQDLLAANQSSDVVFAVMERELSRLAVAASPADAVVREAVVRLTQRQGNARVVDIAAAADISERQFRRRFSAAVGLTPKEFACAIRVRSACIQLARCSRLRNPAHRPAQFPRKSKR
jgi:AraC-like DNA-binding protein